MEKRNIKNGDVIQVSTFRPEKCGIASWTEDVINYSHDEDPGLRNRVFAVNGYRKPHEYADFVDFCIEKNDLDDYLKAAEKINKDDSIKLVSIQHEFGIFGGYMGNFVIDFLDALEKPTLMTLHTIPRDAETDYKTVERKKILKKILPKIDKGIIISNTSKKILMEEYDINPEKFEVILHGVHPFDETPGVSKKILGLENRFVLSTVGLVREKRGLEYVIRALPSVVEKHPDLLYVIAGESHPRELVGDDQPYREKLMEEVKKTNIEENVLFVNKYLPLTSLLRHIQASDACITPYTFPGQISSGVLSYCVGLDKPVISTPFLYAKELLDKGRGIILPDFNNPISMSKAIIEVIENKSKVKKIKRNIASIKKDLMWSNVAKKYIEVEKDLISSFNK